MREQLNKLLEFNTAKDAAHSHALHTKDLEHRLLSTQLKQAQAALELRENQVALLQAEAVQSRGKEKDLHTEVGAYAHRMQGVQEVMEKTSQVMEDMKEEVGKLRKRLKKEGEERVKAEAKVQESTAMLLSVLEDRKQEQLEGLKVKRQLTALQQLCQALEREKRERKEKEKEKGKEVESRSGGGGVEAPVKEDMKGEDAKAQLTAPLVDTGGADLL